MTISYVNGDIFDEFDLNKEQILVHGCNCFHSMSGGIARLIALRYPQAQEADKSNTEFADIDKLGSYSEASIDKNKIINLYTQYQPGANFDINAFKLGILNLEDAYPNHKFIMPKIGAGIGGGDWSEIEEVLINSSLDITVFVI